MLYCKYLEIAAILAERIKTGKYAVFTKLPSENALMRQFGAGRQTIRDAIRELARRKLVRRRQGSGTFVNRQKREGETFPKIGVIVTGGVFSRRFPLLAAELIRLAGEEGFDLLLENTHQGAYSNQKERLAAAFARMAREDVRGILYQPLTVGRDCNQENRRLVSGVDVPIVLMGGDIRTCRGVRPYDTVDMDWFEAGRTLAGHLHQKGVRRMFFLSERYVNGGHERHLFGMKSLVGECGVRLVGGWRGAAEMLKRVERSPDVGGIVGLDGERMRELSAYLQEHPLSSRSLRLAVLGDSVEVSHRSGKRLTAVRGSCMDVTRESFQRLVHRLKDPSVRPVSILLSTHLEIGETS